jgi:signal transduction histidine kinase
VQAASVALAPVLLIGTTLMVLLVGFILLLVLLHQRRVLRHQKELREWEAEKQLQLLQATFTSQERERERLAHDLHDGVGQVLSTVNLNLYRLESLYKRGTPEPEVYQALLRSTLLLAQDSIGEIRSIIRNVKPPLLSEYGLVTALVELCRRIRESSGLEVEFTHSVGTLSFNNHAELSLFRMIQELFSNALRHAKASRLTLRMDLLDDRLVVCFEDDGIGLASEVMKGDVRNGFGLRGLQARTSMLGGQMVMQTLVGTKVQLLLPLCNIRN